MAGRIRQSDVDEVKARTNIADIVGEHVSLKSAGVGSLKGLCPFHDERSPSFHVRPQLGYYHCFGCGESGDVYTFLQRMDHVSFSEAVERLAGRIGFELHYEDGGAGLRPRQPGAAARREPGRGRVLRRAPRLARGRGRAALPRRARIRRRGRRRFGVGFAPKSWDALTDHLKGTWLHDRGARGIRPRLAGRPRRLRPVPRSPRLADPRRHRPDRRLRRAASCSTTTRAPST